MKRYDYNMDGRVAKVSSNGWNSASASVWDCCDSSWLSDPSPSVSSSCVTDSCHVARQLVLYHETKRGMCHQNTKHLAQYLRSVPEVNAFVSAEFAAAGAYVPLAHSIGR